ncbi:hypothetical protein SD81_023055 [Tolypothrix campylonemoides VB511288]|nr:hypothetical protein SD81_023055 [Tolypothrix campylonemoides VB511288]
MEKNQSPPSLEELAVIAKEAAIRAIQAKNDGLSREAEQQALLEKQIKLTDLMTVLMERVKIEIPKLQNNDLSGGYLYEESLQELWLYVCKNIHKYEPKKGSVMGWIYFMLTKKKINVFHWLNWNGRVLPIYINDEGYEMDIPDIKYPDIHPLTREEMIAFLKEDPEGLLASKLFKNNPKASFQSIALKRIEEEKTWKEIVQELELGNTHGPVYKFYIQYCEKYAAYFKKYLCE